MEPTHFNMRWGKLKSNSELLITYPAELQPSHMIDLANEDMRESPLHTGEFLNAELTILLL